MDRTLQNTLICWTPAIGPFSEGSRKATAGQLALLPFPDEVGAYRRYALTAGACYRDAREADLDGRKLRVASELLTILARDKLDPLVVHRAMLPMLEYRDMLPLDAICDEHWLRVETVRRSLDEGD